MSEREPSAERKRVYKGSITCDGCHQEYNLTPENTIIQTLKHQPWLNHIKMRCADNCGTISVRFHDQVGERITTFVTKHFTVAPEEEFCDDENVLAYRGLSLNRELLQPRELTPRQEDQVRNIGGFLAVYNVTVEDFPLAG